MIELAMTAFIMMALVPVLLIVVALVLAVKFMGGSTSRQQRDSEAHLMQEIHDGLMRMEQRIEALETIVLERSEEKVERD
jgi:phage shock protein B